MTFQDALEYFEGNTQEDLRAEYDRKREGENEIGHYAASRKTFEEWLIAEAQESAFCVRHDI